MIQASHELEYHALCEVALKENLEASIGAKYARLCPYYANTETASWAAILHLGPILSATMVHRSYLLIELIAHSSQLNSSS